ncbi:zinc finger CCCH domain-containing protein 14-like [Corylus avellana]|uniref:zinc finger CCCH domain-containing protein 14-like n=1 Tax=Corylus avellana TaxID=13451 RepID=UPI001E1F4BDA|nr:zinc finger CCCH domain-containing protein 14-like [Corylus avellana]
MEKDASPPSNGSANTTAAISSQITSHSAPISPPHPSSPPRDTTRADHLPENQSFGADFASMYHSIFPPKSSSLSLSPSTCCSSSIMDDFNADATATQQRLNQARLILQYHELNGHYDLCRASLLDLIAEADVLRQENAELRVSNAELLKLLSSQASFHNRLLSSPANPDRSFLHHFRRLSIDEERTPTTTTTNRFDRISSDRFTLPKSISVRSTGFAKAHNLPAATSNPSPSLSFTRPRVPSQLAAGSQKVYVPGKRDEEQEALELEVYNQGMIKTELCNKWQETGTCPYGDHCQFAHGITELRPVIRHPRYKTEVCRMVLAGSTCPYGHRCHFRHSLNDQEKMLLGPR